MSAPRRRLALVRVTRPTLAPAALVVVGGVSILLAAAALGVAAAAAVAVRRLGVRTLRIRRTLLDFC